MAWTFDDSSAEGTQGVQSAVMRRYYEWRRRIRENGQAPNDAADYVGSMNFKQLGGATQYQVRLSKKHRVAFTVDWGKQDVTVLQIGGHT